MHDIDALAGDQVREQLGVAPDAQRIDRVDRHRQPFAAEGAQFADQRSAVAGDDGAGAGLQQRQRDIDRGMAGRIVAQRRHQLQNGGAGSERELRAQGSWAFLAHDLSENRSHFGIMPAPLAFEAGLRREDGSSEIAFILSLTQSAHERSSPDIPDDRIAAAEADHRRARARGQEQQQAPRPVLAGRLQVRHEGHQGRRRSIAGPKAKAVPACASTIPATANRAATSMTAPSAAGWRRASRSTRNSPKARRW